MKIDSILVVAYKYNDILFTLGTEEFINSKYKKLLLFKLPNYSLSDFPFLEKFDEVLVFNYNKENVKLNVIDFFLYVMRNKVKLSANLLFISNPYLLHNKILFKISSFNEVILLEDGLMNYVPISNEISLLKSMVQKFIGANNLTLLDNTRKTYLSLPEKATLFRGDKKKLVLLQGVESDLEKLLQEVSGKNFFIGQNLYPRYCSEAEYYLYVNKVLEKFNVDFYVPHAYEKYTGQLGDFPIFHVKKYTFEYLAQFTSFNIYSFGSSLLLTAKVVNRKVKSNIITIDCCNSFYIAELLSICDNTYVLE